MKSRYVLNQVKLNIFAQSKLRKATDSKYKGTDQSTIELY